MKRGIIFALVAAALFSSCGKENGASSGAGGKITLDLMHYYTPEDTRTSVNARGYHYMKEKFLAEHPNVTLNETVLQQTDYHTRMMALAAADELPDIYFNKGSWIGNFYANNLMADLSGLVDLAPYREGILAPYSRDGKVYGLPTQLQYTSLVFYNEQMFKDVGYDHFPATWEELLDAGQKLSAKGITPIALGNKDRWPAESCIFSTLGDRVTGTEWTQSIVANDGKAKFTDAVFVTLLDYFQKMVPLFNVNFNEIVNQQADVLFATGKAAATVEGNWTVSWLLKEAEPEILEHIRIAYLPSFPGQKGVANAVSGGSAWAQSVSGKLEGEKLRLAAEYVQLTTGAEFCEYIFDQEGLLGPCVVQFEESDTADLPPLARRYIDYVGSIVPVPIYDAEMEGAVIDVMNSRLQELLNKTITPRQLAEAVQVEQDKLSK